VELPEEPKPPLSHATIRRSSAAQLRELSGDGVFGGAYTRPEEDVLAVWEAGVAEVRELLSDGWEA
jgi:creatinine amidohydrolase